MRIIVTLQRDYRTISVLENDRGEAVAVFNQPRLVTVDELFSWAQMFRDQYPELFHVKHEEVKNGSATI